MNASDRAAKPARNAPALSARVQSAPTDTDALDEIARLANVLCDHLADDQWRTADRIRHLAETARPSTGAC
ncbi:MAG: hypothetical protein WCD21_40655 [Streptomyces sp.]